MKIVPEISLRHDLQYFLFISTPTIDIEPKVTKIPADGITRLPVLYIIQRIRQYQRYVPVHHQKMPAAPFPER